MKIKQFNHPWNGQKTRKTNANHFQVFGVIVLKSKACGSVDDWLNTIKTIITIFNKEFMSVHFSAQ